MAGGVMWALWLGGVLRACCHEAHVAQNPPAGTFSGTGACERCTSACEFTSTARRRRLNQASRRMLSMERTPRSRLHSNVICLSPQSSLKVRPDPSPGYAVNRPGDPSGLLPAKVFS